MVIKNYSEKASSKDFDRISSIKSRHQIKSTGAFAQISSSGNNVRIISEGKSARISSAGFNALIDSTGLYAVICCAGRFSHVKAKIGSWITLTEWEYSEDSGAFVPTHTRTAQVDGKRIKEDVYYYLTDGDFMEV